MPTPDTSGLPSWATFEDIKLKITEIVAKYNNLLVNLDSLNVVSLTADHIDAGTIDADKVTIRGQDGTKFFQLDDTGITANNGSFDTMKFDLATGLLTIVSMILKSANSNEKVELDATGFHSYDPSGVERITIGTTPAKGAKALITRDTAGAVQGAYVYDTETVDGASRTGQYITAHGAYVLLSNDGDFRIQNAAGSGIRAVSGTPEINDGFGWSSIAKQGISGQFYVATTSGGPVTTRATFTDGVLTSLV